MYWCILHVKNEKYQEILDFFDREEDTYAFIPKVEKWFKCSEFSAYQLKDMYPGYIFIKSLLDEESFKSKYENLFRDINGLKLEEFVSFEGNNENEMFWLFNNQGVITHSIGQYNGDKLKIMEGPLCGFETKIKKINRHKRIAKVDFNFLGMNMILPLEVINGKGSV